MELPGNPKTSGNFSLQWNGYESHLTGGMKVLLTDERLADVTLACEGKYIRAHKLILSLCSPYFKTLFELHNGDRGVTIVILNHVRIKDLENILCYAYTGQVQVHQSDLNSFLQTGELLQVEGLTSCTSESKEEAVSDTGITNTNPETSRQRSSIGTAGRGDEASDNSARNSRSRNSPPPSSVGKKNDDDMDIHIAHTTGGNSIPNAHARPNVHDRNFEGVGRSGVINYEQEAETFQGGIHEHSGCDEEKEVNMALLKDEAIEVLEIHDYGDHSAGSRHHTSEMRMESQSDYLTDPIAVPSTSAGPMAGSSHQSKSTRDALQHHGILSKRLRSPKKTATGSEPRSRQQPNAGKNASSLRKKQSKKYRVCPHCGGLFYQSNISRHISQVHTEKLLETGQQVFICPFCKAVYRNSKTFEAHLQKAHDMHTTTS